MKSSSYPSAKAAASPIVAKKLKKRGDVGKPNNGKTTGFAVVAKKAAAEYGSAAAGKRVAGAVYQNMKKSGKL